MKPLMRFLELYQRVCVKQETALETYEHDGTYWTFEPFNSPTTEERLMAIVFEAEDTKNAIWREQIAPRLGIR